MDNKIKNLLLYIKNKKSADLYIDYLNHKMNVKIVHFLIISLIKYRNYQIIKLLN